MVAFSVYKSSKYLFDCVGIADAASQPYPTVGSDALEALRLHAVDVVKRIDYAEVDRLIACCMQHPPQTVVVPSTHGDIIQFQEFATYLKGRQRAGVVLLEDGRLLILAPLEKDDSGLRCVVVKAKSTAETPAPPTMAPIRANEAAPAGPQQVEKVDILRSSDAGEQPRRRRVRPRSRGRSQEGVADTVRDDDSQTESKQNNQAAVGTRATARNEKLEMLYHLPRIERATKIAQLRQEYEAFNELHYELLREWSKSDPDS
ncbi:hypothetical protein V7S43_006078 [Phytophthora oleae]|uniref:Spen paralogue and orthologue SPOC C-terminal domain-containing protein n=1 Tax=Phytophthora oleae TaxID=2107226 RepID=A0ABD3FT30_9STRA